MKVQVVEISVPMGSTVGTAIGWPVGADDVVDATKEVSFAGDWRAMQALAAFAMLAESVGEPTVIEVPDWAILGIRETPTD